MVTYCRVCDNTIKFKSKTNHLLSLTQNQNDKCIQTNHTIKNPDFFDIDKIITDYSTNHV